MAITGRTLHVTNLGSAEGNALITSSDHDNHCLRFSIVPVDLLVDGADFPPLTGEVAVHGTIIDEEQLLDWLRVVRGG